MARRPRGGERVHLGHRADDTRQLVRDRLGERLDRTVGPRTREDEVVRRGAQGRADDVAVLSHDPAAELGIDVGMVARERRDPECEVVPRLVLEEELPGLPEERTAPLRISTSTARS